MALAGITKESLVLWVMTSCLVLVLAYRPSEKDRRKRAVPWVLAMLTFYILFVLTITLFSRRSKGHTAYILDVFWSYRAALEKKPELLVQNFWNIVLFIPNGAMLCFLLRPGWKKTAFVSAAFTISIEAAQLFTCRGLFELDDILHNMAGAMIGYFLCRFALKTRKKILFSTVPVLHADTYK